MKASSLSNPCAVMLLWPLEEPMVTAPEKLAAVERNQSELICRTGLFMSLAAKRIARQISGICGQVHVPVSR